jgi:hypothetical protein
LIDEKQYRWDTLLTRRLQLAALEARMIAAAPIVLEHIDEPQADGDNPDGSDTDAEQDSDGRAERNGSAI